MALEGRQPRGAQPQPSTLSSYPLADAVRPFTGVNAAAHKQLERGGKTFLLSENSSMTSHETRVSSKMLQS